MLFDELKKQKLMALKNKNEAAKAILPIVINKCMLLQIEKKTKDEELTDGDTLNLIIKTIKELDDEIASFKKANREDKVAELSAQQEYLKTYLPKQLSKEEILEEINKLEDKTIPNIMKHFKANFNGQVDMKLVSEVAKSL